MGEMMDRCERVMREGFGGDTCRGDSVAFIEALRTPTRAMLRAACKVPPKIERRREVETAEESLCRAIWEAMVDSILSGEA